MSAKKQKGFIQIPLLLIIIASAVIVSAEAGYILYKQGKLNNLGANISNIFNNKDIGLRFEQARLDAEKAKQEEELLKTELEKQKQSQTPIPQITKPESSQIKIKTTSQTGTKMSRNTTTPAINTEGTINNAIQTTTVKLSNLNSFIDSAITLYEENISYAKKIIKSTDFYDDNFSKSKILMSLLFDAENEPSLKEGWRILKDVLSMEIAYNQTIRDNCLANIKNMEDTIAILQKEKEKNLLSDPVNIERYWAYFDELKKTINVDQYTKTLSVEYDTFLSKTDKFQSDLRFALDLARIKMDSYHSSLISGYQNARDSLRTGSTNQPTPIDYQPVVYPTIQMPKTTHCTISGDGGVGLQAYITCSTY